MFVFALIFSGNRHTKLILPFTLFGWDGNIAIFGLRVGGGRQKLFMDRWTMRHHDVGGPPKNTCPGSLL